MAAQPSNRTILALFSPELLKKTGFVYGSMHMEQANNMTCSRRQGIEEPETNW